MSPNEIVVKLNQFIASHTPVSEECHVVYLLVEIRKLLDHIQDHPTQGAFTLLRFYCDWMVHTKKDRITPSMRAVLGTVYKEIKAQIAEPKFAGLAVVQFANMEGLRIELEQLFRNVGIVPDLVTTGWTDFVQLLVKVLDHQPINKPIAEITSFSFVPVADGKGSGLVEFSAPLGGYHDYTFLIVY